MQGILPARQAHVSAEHLRRLCRKALGRTPMHHGKKMPKKDARHYDPYAPSCRVRSAFWVVVGR